MELDNFNNKKFEKTDSQNNIYNSDFLMFTVG